MEEDVGEKAALQKRRRVREEEKQTSTDRKLMSSVPG